MPNIFELIDRFISDQDVADNSKKLYNTNIILFFRWITEQAIDLENIIRADVIRYKKQLEDNKYSSLTIHSRLTTIRKFFKWCKLNSITDDITIGIKNPRISNEFRRLPLNETQILQLFTTIDNGTTTKDKRDKALIKLMLCTGIRTIEASRLDCGDIEERFNTHVIRVQGKGQKEKNKIIDVDSDTMEDIHDYLLTRNSFTESDPLFITYNRGNKGHRLTPNSIGYIIKGKFKSAGIKDKKISPHSLRHTAAIIMMNSGMDHELIRARLRHTNSNITRIYTKMVEQGVMIKSAGGSIINNYLKNLKETNERLNNH